MKRILNILGKISTIIVIIIVALWLSIILFIFKWYVFQILVALCYALMIILIRILSRSKHKIITSLMSVLVIVVYMIICFTRLDYYGVKIPKYEISQTYDYKPAIDYYYLKYDESNISYLNNDGLFRLLDYEFNIISEIVVPSPNINLINVKDEKIVHIEENDHESILYIYDLQGNLLLSKDMGIQDEFKGSFINSQGELIYYTNKDFYKVSTDGVVAFLYSVNLYTDQAFSNVFSINDTLLIYDGSRNYIYRLDENRQVKWQKRTTEKETVENIIDDEIFIYNFEDDNLMIYDFDDGKLIKKNKIKSLNDIIKFKDNYIVSGWEYLSVYNKDFELTNQNVIGLKKLDFLSRIFSNKDNLYIMTLDGSYKLREVNLPKTIYFGAISYDIQMIIVPALLSGLFVVKKSKENKKETTSLEL